MTATIQKAAVLGSGVMGSSIAAHLANVGISVLLLDVVPKETNDKEKAKGLTTSDRSVRNRFSEQAKQKLRKQKPAPLTSKSKLSLIEAGNMEDDMQRLSEADWIIEAVIEDLGVKQHVLKVVEGYRKPGSIVSSNTSGIAINEMADGLSEEFRSHFLGTHFFNPPRYLKLLELIPNRYTDPAVKTEMKDFAENTLGKGVVEAKDTPNFIANRIGTYGFLITVHEMLRQGWSVSEVDSITGAVIGRPKSATFRTLDVVGLDTFLHVAKNVYDKVDGQEKSVFQPPAFMKEMEERGWLGSKSGQGFYKKVTGENGKEILELDVDTFTYQPRKRIKAKSLEEAGRKTSTREKLKTLVYADDQAGRFIWNILKPLLLYTAEKAEEIANNIAAVDQAMKWGFGFELGPFETWDAIGVEQSAARMEEEGETLPVWVKEMLHQGYKSFYSSAQEYYHKGKYLKINSNTKNIDLGKRKAVQGAVIHRNAGASFIDIGDGVACLELHSPNDSIGLDAIHMINTAVYETEKNYKGLVIASRSKNFCVGANIMMMLMEAQDDNFVEIDMVVRKFQQAMQKIKYAKRPVVAAPYGMTLGGGTELCLPAASIQAASETYMGLVETGVGLIPAGGGTKELYRRHIESFPQHGKKELLAAANQVFEKIALASVSTSAEEAKDNKFLSSTDNIIFNQDHLLYYARQKVLHLYETGYKPPLRQKIPVTGKTGYAAMKLGAKTFHFGGRASAHDVKIAEKLAFVIAGGNVACGTLVDEDYLLDLEREAFLNLMGEPKSQARMQYMLMKGKALRN
ncbi:3-hydroxyacyl-CoA dehydrogenase [Alteribacillus persepolensis]|uniref:3-hydroxyacyl-CoA dehydrogenase n=1 Tax=Alteribacillus persepolensis TaxID=568899 RepID=A0A1G8DV87_9BACI|nr:3-hydroxyacyl-CoA dehydrogenase/enoyl-CoA hydratase family protein [Alteribacillus persepolensis]SDH61370.1 3-hydroxyacyl-CoA dehydrogenase [Alteribacillus persepolensis]